MSGADSTWARHGRPLVSLDQAWAILRAEVQSVGSEVVPLAEAQGRALARTIVADDDSPAFDKAMMDGFAVRAADCSAPASTLRVIGLASAGEMFDRPVDAGTAVKINTGSPIPAGADAVVRVEDTSAGADERSVVIKTSVVGGANLVRRGEHRRRGEAVLESPRRMGPAQIGAAASAGAAHVEVFRRVEAAIVSTGDELVPAGSARRAGQIFESNGPMLAALCRQFGAAADELGIVPDRQALLAERFGEALKRPVVLAVGGMSMGTRDLVPATMESLGVRWLFHGVEMRPGKPVAYGRGPAGQHVFGLPGNPASAFVCAWLLVKPAIEGLGGSGVRRPRTWRATLASELKASRDPRPVFVPARVECRAEEGMMAEPCRWGGSGDPFGLAQANALLVRWAPTESAAAGSEVECILLESE